MSSTDILAPNTTSAIRPKRGLASFKTMFSSKRHSIAQIPSSTEATDLSVPSSPALSVDSSTETPSTEASSRGHNAVTSLFAPSQKKALEKAVEKEKKDQAKHSIQLSTVNEQGTFVPPTPLEKGYREHFTDNDEDYFYTIISTPPDRVRTFLSTESTISPGMFSLPSSKIKRHTWSSFPVTTSSTTGTISSSGSSPQLSPNLDFIDEDLTAPVVPSKDVHYTPKRQQPKNNRVQIAYLTGSEDSLSEALSGSISSLLPSPSLQEVPELMMDDDESESMSSSSAHTSPRHSTASLHEHHQQQAKAVRDQMTMQESFGSELPLGY
ncbi:hypothetical protein BGZ54_003554 [Gamsiella multidivaricata]|nr:hypothetical protein BGZ54_003554 [Gamsiella multidivaricata]